MAWSGGDIDGRGKRILVTGASGPVGVEVLRVLVEAGAEPVLAGRDVAEARAVAAELRPSGPPLQVVTLDPEAPSAAARCARALGTAPLDAVVHLRAPGDPPGDPLVGRHLVPFALTALLVPQLTASGAGRVVVVTDAPTDRRFPFEAGLQPADGVGDESRAALASLLATFELQRRFEASRLPVRCIACTPGDGVDASAPPWLGRWGAAWAARRSRSAVAPVVVATLAADVIGGDWLGIGRQGEVVRLEPPPASRDVSLARRLVRHSEEVTGVRLAPG